MLPRSRQGSRCRRASCEAVLLRSQLADGSDLSLTQQELNEALQYSPTPGIPKFLAQLKQLQLREHKPRMAESTWAVSVSTGSTDALFKAFEMLVEEVSGRGMVRACSVSRRAFCLADGLL